MQIVNWMAAYEPESTTFKSFGLLRENPIPHGYYYEMATRGYVVDHYWDVWKGTGVPLRVGKDCFLSIFTLREYS